MAIGLEYSFAEPKSESGGRKFHDFRFLLIFVYYFKIIKADVPAYENTYISHNFASASGFCDSFFWRQNIDVKI